MTKYIHFNNSHFEKKMSRTAAKAYQSKTVAVEAPSAETIKALANEFLHDQHSGNLVFALHIGVSLLHPDDQYEKKAGRDQAVAKMKGHPLSVESVNVTRTHIFVSLSVFGGIRLCLRLNKNTGFSTVLGQMINGDAY
jgi:hypothetical protein